MSGWNHEKESLEQYKARFAKAEQRVLKAAVRWAVRYSKDDIFYTRAVYNLDQAIVRYKKLLKK